MERKMNRLFSTAFLLLKEFEDGLRRRLEGLAYQMPSQALLPDERITGWVLA